MAHVKNILMLKKRTMNIDELIRQNEVKKLKLEEQKEALEASKGNETTLEEPKKEFRECGTQTSSKVLKTTSTQTVSSNENEDSKPKKNFISFFNTKSLFSNKKPKSKLVKFVVNGRLAHGKDVIPAFELPGHRSFELNRHEFTLPHAREYNQALEEEVSEGPKSPKKKSRKLVESPKKDTKKNKESPLNQRKKKDTKKTTAIPPPKKTMESVQGGFDSSSSKPSSKNGAKVFLMPATVTSHVDFVTSDDISANVPIESPKKSEVSLKLKKPKLPASSDNSVHKKDSTVEETSTTTARQPKNISSSKSFQHSEKSKAILQQKKSLIPEPSEFIPLGRNHLPGPSKNERSASFKLTPEALKAINARKVPIPSRPMRKPLKRPAKHDENDPTQKKRLRVLRPAAAAPAVVVKEVADEVAIAKDLELSDEEEDDDEVSPKRKSIKFRILDDDDLDLDPQEASNDLDASKNMEVSDSVEDEEITFNDSPIVSEESTATADAEDVLTLSETVEFEDEEQVAKGETINEAALAANTDVNVTMPIRKSQEMDTKEKEAIFEGGDSSLGKILGKVVAQNKQEDEMFVCDGSFLEFMVKKFKADQSERQSRLDKKKANNRVEFQLDRQLINDVVKSQLKRLWRDVEREVLYDIVQNLTKDEAQMKIRKRLIIQQLYTTIREEKGWEVANYFVPGGAKMTNLQAKIFTLLIHLEPKMNGVMREMADFCSILTFATSQNGLNSYKLFQLANVTRMLMILLRHLGDEKMARLFLYDTIFFRNSRAHVMITILIDTWPQLLQQKSQSSGNGCNLETNQFTDPVFEAVIWMIYNAGPPNSLSDLKVYEARDKLKRYCQQPKPSFTADEFIKSLFQIVESNHHDKVLCLSATKAFLLLAKWQEFNWANNHIVSRLLEMLHGWDQMALNEKGRNINKWVINTLAHVLRVYPQDARDNLLAIFEAIQEVIQKPNIDAELEEMCLRAILWAGHHLQLQAARFFFDWKPRFKLDATMQDAVANFVGLRASRFSEKTLEIKKKEELMRLKKFKRQHRMKNQ